MTQPDVDIKKALSAFSLGQLQTFRNIIKTIEISGHTVNDVTKFTEHMFTISPLYKGKPCPRCSNRMKLYEVNTNKGNQIGGDYKSQWQCTRCSYEIFSGESVVVEKNKAKAEKS